MTRLNLPDFPKRIKQEDDFRLIYDEFRRKYVVLTPEEWVRQHFLHYLVTDKGYPKSLIKVESGLKVNKMAKRTDVIVYSRAGQPFMLIECKSAQMSLNEKVFDQLSIYNQTLKAQYLVITNGLKHYCCSMDYQTSSYEFHHEIPEYA